MERCAELAAASAPSSTARARGRARRSGRGPGAAAVTQPPRRPLYPVELQERVDALPRGPALRRRAAAPSGSRRRCATRCSPAASASGRCSRWPPPRRSAATRREVLPLAAAIEMIHTYSLIHDDLPAMDDDELRRGQPTCHVAFGEDVAILAGDGLFAEALRLAATEQQGEPGRRARRGRASWRARPASGGMVGGQYLDVTADGDLGRRRAAPPARAEDRPADRGVGRLRAASCAARADLPHIASAVSRRSSASCSRSSTTSST